MIVQEVNYWFQHKRVKVYVFWDHDVYFFKDFNTCCINRKTFFILSKQFALLIFFIIVTNSLSLIILIIYNSAFNLIAIGKTTLFSKLDSDSELTI